MTSSLRRALRGRLAILALSSLGLAGLLAQQTATAPRPHPFVFIMNCESPIHPEWGHHGCADPAWTTTS
jgi:hypothetical protein